MLGLFIKYFYICVLFDVFLHHLYFTKYFGRKANRLGNKQKATIYNSIPKEKKINAEDNRMKVDCVHFNFQKIGLRSVVNQRNVRRRMKKQGKQVCLKRHVLSRNAFETRSEFESPLRSVILICM